MHTQCPSEGSELRAAHGVLPSPARPAVKAVRLLARGILTVGFVALTAAMAHAQVKVQIATYGFNCGASSGNATNPVAASCNGRTRCDYRVDARALGNPNPGCDKDFSADYLCQDGSFHKVRAAREASGQTVTLECPAVPTHTQPAGGQCASEGQRCEFKGKATVFYGAKTSWVAKHYENGVLCSTAVFGDVAPGVGKQCYVLGQQASRPAGTPCAADGQRCGFSGTASVYYGAQEKWVVRQFDNGVDCTSKVFGDPAPHARKECFFLAPGAQDRTRRAGARCAAENERCTFAGTATVYYGAGNKWASGQFTNGVACNNATFGDPAPNIVKECYVGQKPAK